MPYYNIQKETDQTRKKTVKLFNERKFHKKKRQYYKDGHFTKRCNSCRFLQEKFIMNIFFKNVAYMDAGKILNPI